MRQRIQDALADNVNFTTDPALGYPVSNLDPMVFSSDAAFLGEAPTLQVFVANPNHIGCHTYGVSEKAFTGTQKLEREILEIIAVDIFKSLPAEYDGYIASGGTEANLQAIWIYRNLFISKFGAQPHEITIVCSEDTHYSIPKASNLMLVDLLKIPVDKNTRVVDGEKLDAAILAAKMRGKKYFIAVSNMGTTMFGSVDNPDIYSGAFKKHGVHFKIHVDGAYGGFVYPISNPNSSISFQNQRISSFTIDAHKMLQAPYGTGIFVCRKGLIENTITPEASYVKGLDLTLCGSRSGSNAVAVWTILHTYGAKGWSEKIGALLQRTDWLCAALSAKRIGYFREPHMNIVAIESKYVPQAVAEHFNLVPETHDAQNSWYKVIIMEHVRLEHLGTFIKMLGAAPVATCG